MRSPSQINAASAHTDFYQNRDESQWLRQGFGMTPEKALLARTLLGLFTAFAGLFLLRLRPLYRMDSEKFDRGITWIFAASRLGLFFLLFVVLHFAVRGDVIGYYFPQAKAVSAGQIIYRDFHSSYAPLFGYINSAAIHLWKSPAAIILLAILIECAAYIFWIRISRSYFDDATHRAAALLYLTSPISIQFVAVDGQNNVLILFFIALALIYLRRNHSFAVGLALGLCFLSTKFLVVLFLPLFFSAVRKKLSYLLGFVIPVIPVYAALLLLHAPILQPLQEEGSLRGPSNLPYLLDTFSGRLLPSPLLDGVTAIVLLSAAGWCYWLIQRSRAAGRAVPLVAMGTGLLIVLLCTFSKKSWPNYLIIGLYPLCFVAAIRGYRWMVMLTALSVVAVTEHSYWATLLDSIQSNVYRAQLFSGDRLASVYLLLLISLLIGYGCLVWLCLENGSAESRAMVRNDERSSA